MLSSIVANSITQLQELREGIISGPYVMFKFSIRSEITRKYYQRRIRHFFDFIKFDLENKNMSKNAVMPLRIKGAAR